MDEQPLLQLPDTRTRATAADHLHRNRDHPYPARGLLHPHRPDFLHRGDRAYVGLSTRRLTEPAL
jgi:hypothetical protein